MIPLCILNCFCKSIAVNSCIYLSLLFAGSADNCSIPYLNWQVGPRVIGEIGGQGLTVIMKEIMSLRKCCLGKRRNGGGGTVTQPKLLDRYLPAVVSGLGLCSLC
jgi:hypothetical protein